MNFGPIEEAIKVLSEHYDCVVILASTHEEGNTGYSFRRTGNYFAAREMCREYIKHEDHESLAGKINNNNDTGEEWKQPD